MALFGGSFEFVFIYWKLEGNENGEESCWGVLWLKIQRNCRVEDSCAKNRWRFGNFLQNSANYGSKSVKMHILAIQTF